MGDLNKAFDTIRHPELMCELNVFRLRVVAAVVVVIIAVVVVIIVAVVVVVLVVVVVERWL